MSCLFVCVCSLAPTPPSPLLQSSNLRCGGGGPLSALSDFGGGGPLSPFCGLLSAFGGLLFFVGLGCLFWELNCDKLPNNLHQNYPHVNTLPSGALGGPPTPILRPKMALAHVFRPRNAWAMPKYGTPNLPKRGCTSLTGRTLDEPGRTWTNLDEHGRTLDEHRRT